MSKERKIVFNMVMSDSVTLKSEAQVNIPDTASMPYLLTKIASKANDVLANVKIDRNYPTILMWFYNRHYLKNHGLDTQAKIVNAVSKIVRPVAYDDLTTDNIYKTAKKIAESVLMPSESLKVMDKLNASDQSSLLCGAIVWSMLVNNRTITNETEIDFVDLLDNCGRSKEYMEQLKAAVALVNRTVELNLIQNSEENEYCEELLLTSETHPSKMH